MLGAIIGDTVGSVYEKVSLPHGRLWTWILPLAIRARDL